MPVTEQTQAHCNECGKETTHGVLCSATVSDSDGGIDWSDHYDVLKCGGCGHVTFRKRFWFSEWQDPDPEADPVYEVTYFPPPLFRVMPEWFSELNDSLSEVLTELYVALQNNVRFLAAVGARTALDIVLVDKVSDKGTFADKLKALEDRQLVSSAEREMLAAVTEAGNAAAHRGYAPDEEDLIAVMDILEAVIEKLYVKEKREQELLQRAQGLRDRVPSRREP